MMKNRKWIPAVTSEVKAMEWLTYLARGMQQHGQTVFQIEELQPSWLQSQSQLFLYILLSRLIVGLTIGIILTVVVGLPVGVMMGLASGLMVGTIDVIRSIMDHGKHQVTAHSSRKRIALRFIGVGLPVWFLGLLIGWQVGNAFLGLTLGWMFGAVYGVTYGLRTRNLLVTHDIRTVETLRWSWQRAFKYGLLGLIIGVIIGLIVESTYRVFLDVPLLGFRRWWFEAPLLVALVGALCGVIFGGLDSGIISIKVTPNQGIRLTIRNSVFAAVVTGLTIGFVGLVSTDTLGDLLVSYTGLYRLQGGIVFALTGGLLVALWYGGLDIIQHYTLRSILLCKGYTPLHLIHFLDYAAEELVILQKVGGGYMFIHRYLQEYFASRDDRIETNLDHQR